MFLTCAKVIATSGPSSTYPQRAYRNPTDALVKFLDYKHDINWAIWEFRAEGTGYPDSEVYGRIRHYPWPDHHPPPFALIPNIMASMRDWLKGPETNEGRVVVVHCKAGKGRSGTAACSYLISEEHWSVEEALLRFTSKRMRLGFGAGVSIPSQLRWIRYVDRWSKHNKIYVERQIEIVEVHAWGLRDGVKVAADGYVDEGKTIKNFHTFSRDERIIIEGEIQAPGTAAATPTSKSDKSLPFADAAARPGNLQTTSSGLEAGGTAVIFRPATPIILPTNDINIDFERRNKASYGWTMVTSVAHVWFNTFFEGNGPENDGKAASSGVFEIDWDAMDGIKGSARKGTRALDRLAVVWRIAPDGGGQVKPKLEQIITEPKEGGPVQETRPADWKSATHSNLTTLGKDLGMRTASPASVGVSKASSLKSAASSTQAEDDPMAGVKPHGPNGEEFISHQNDSSEVDPTKSVEDEVGLGGIADIASRLQKSKMDDVSKGKAGEGLETSKQHLPGQLLKEDER